MVFSDVYDRALQLASGVAADHSVGNEVKAEEFGLLFEALELALLLLLEIIVFAQFLVVSAMFDHIVEDDGQFPGGGGNRFGPAESGAHAAVKGAQIGLAFCQRPGCRAKCPGRTALDLSGL
jgi:hypothetical protein